MAKEASKATKSEKKLGIALGGIKRGPKPSLSASPTRSTNSLRPSRTMRASPGLRSMSLLLVPGEWRHSKEEVEVLVRRERLLQERYAELDRERRDAESRVTALEERIMAEAEALNEAALAEMEA
ncbi:hypothetical protein HYDPIDRAFT_191001 [Hydnomerulius pinastri MD-312]|uniref:Uncharacterized protein n=1 Tax=Hydnomerulius pinastri MD-312 TaxID=994086 RepID=A0A0C9VJT5_9AGAM|nr:hypothetical protein HYDPIDRAFT_191001 [Hydnomerulius pinastri MD-312]